MRYITSAERLGIQKGRREGSYKTYFNLIQNMKNKNLSDVEICEYTNLDMDTLKKIINNDPMVDIPLHLLD